VRAAPADLRGVAKAIPGAIKDDPPHGAVKDVSDVSPAPSLFVLSVSVTLFLVACILQTL